ncbi:MAG TPA: hypothetical protein VI731_12310 [Bacteroidia bacterium]|nr:hypothetical protein [Bacteroidia bacterium]
MGRKENIKRTKHLREIKEKKILAALEHAGIGPLDLRVKHRENLEKTKPGINQDMVDYAELIRDFVSPLINQDDNLDSIRTKIVFGITVWNAAVLQDAGGEIYLLAKSHVDELIDETPELGEQLDSLVGRKYEDFEDYDHLISGFEFKRLDDRSYELKATSLSLFK